MDLNRRSFITTGVAAAAVGALAPFASAPLLGQGVPKEALDPIAYLDPELRAAARQLLESGNLSLSAETLPQVRAEGRATSEPPLADIPVQERRVPVSAGAPPVTVYVVNGGKEGARPAILHTHGGGHILGSARGELRYLQQLASELDCVLVTVEYRLAPETRFTGSVEDNYAALRWLHANAAELGADPSRIALLGESAGGTHAALLAIAARDRGEVPVLFQALVYPMLDDRTGSTRQTPPWIGAVLWDAKANQFGWRAFLGSEPGGPDVPVAGVPARIEDLSGLPPAWVGVGGADLFVEEDITYARRLTEAGVATELLVVPRAFHGFDRIVPNAAVSQRFTAAKMDALGRALGRGAA